MVLQRLANHRTLRGYLLAIAIVASCRSGFCSTSAIERLVMRGNEEEAKGHYSMAVKIYLSALAHDPNNVRLLLMVAKSQEQLGDLDQAIMRARLATQIEPGNVQAHLQLGQSLQANRDPKAAELQYERVLDLTINDNVAAAARKKVVDLLVELDDLERADRLSRLWVKKHDKDADCHFNRGLVLSQSEKTANLQEALKEFKKCLLLAPDYNMAHYQQALLYLKQNETELARTELKVFINSNPPPQELEQAKAKLAQLK